MSASAENPDKMFALQKQRLGIVIRLTQENAMVLTLQQRVAGKEIEVLVAERHAAEGAGFGSAPEDIVQIMREHEQMQELLEHHERTVAGMETQLKEIEGEIATLCQS
jgi:hypothetical protein